VVKAKVKVKVKLPNYPAIALSAEEKLSWRFTLAEIKELTETEKHLAILEKEAEEEPKTETVEREVADRINKLKAFNDVISAQEEKNKRAILEGQPEKVYPVRSKVPIPKREEFKALILPELKGKRKGGYQDYLLRDRENIDRKKRALKFSEVLIAHPSLLSYAKDTRLPQGCLVLVDNSPEGDILEETRSSNSAFRESNIQVYIHKYPRLRSPGGKWWVTVLWCPARVIVEIDSDGDRHYFDRFLLLVSGSKEEIMSEGWKKGMQYVVENEE